MTAAEKRSRIRELRRRRPRRPFLRASGLAVIAIIVACWAAGDFLHAELVSPRRLTNLERFLTELEPYPLQQGTPEPGELRRWLGDLMAERGFEATRVTLAISVLAIVLAGLFGGVASIFAARNIQRPVPFSNRATQPLDARRSSRLRRLGRVSVVAITRLVLIFLRAIPEFVWAFLLLIALGPTAWPAVLALALHNSGILGKLDAEVIEDLPPAPLAALRDLGANRVQIVLGGVLPMTLPRFLLLFFYRWETCVREATVLGLLGIVSLGYWIEDARARQHYDEMLIFILLGSLLVIVGDLISTSLRTVVRRWS